MEQKTNLSSSVSEETHWWSQSKFSCVFDLFITQVHPDKQGDQIGQFFAYCVIVNFGHSEVVCIFGLFVYMVKAMHSFWQEEGCAKFWATFRAIFWQTHLVTLLIRQFHRQAVQFSEALRGKKYLQNVSLGGGL
jgi:hypothetical protein